MTGREDTAGQRWARAVVMTGVVLTAVYVMRPFLAPMAWAAVLAYASWPLFERVERTTGGRTAPAAALMTAVIVLGVLVPAALLSTALAAEVQRTFSGRTLNLGALRDAAIGWLGALPVIGPRLADQVAAAIAGGEAAEKWVLGQAGSVASAVTALAGGVGRAVLDIAVTLITLYTLYRHGHALAGQLVAVTRRSGGERLAALLTPLGSTVRAVTYGTLLTALVQGSLVMLGCWAAGLPAPVLLGALTGVLALTPVGPPLVYVPASIWLFVQGRYLAGGLLLAWGVVVVSTVDNVLRSWFLSGAVRIPFLLGLLGLLGGLTAFGAIGLFLGPVSVALVLTLWREWAEPARRPRPGPGG